MGIDIALLILFQAGVWWFAYKTGVNSAINQYYKIENKKEKENL